MGSVIVCVGGINKKNGCNESPIPHIPFENIDNLVTIDKGCTKFFARSVLVHNMYVCKNTFMVI